MKTNSFDVIATMDDQEDVAQLFSDVGFHDATLIVRDDHICLSFNRVAASMEEAIVSATHTIAQAGARIIRIDRNNELDTLN